MLNECGEKNRETQIKFLTRKSNAAPTMRMKPNLGNYNRMRKKNRKTMQMLEKIVIQLCTKSVEEKYRDRTEVVKQTLESSRSRR